MDFAILNFTVSGAIFIVGIMTLKKVSSPNEVVFASLPLFFSLHQFTQGFVWLGMDHLIGGRALHMAESIFVFYAQGLLQFLVPLAIWLLQPAGIRKHLIAFLMFLGALLTAYSLWKLSIVPTHVSIVDGVLAYDNPATKHLWLAVGYIITTCGALILSSSIAIQLFGWLNLLGLTVVYLIKPYGFTSLWCLYAAGVSILLYFYFVERRIRFLQDIREKEIDMSKTLTEELAKLEHHYPSLAKSIK
ncbi:DUF6629 family protein [Sulfurovum sp. NBC37-1]|uniref:DUF6629 family protein n=1 Tax=Sulfurovum sp. (strain NBC37-1) TaxID=387093 RepID=UPI0001587BED|nr:DUF6629 family protein [Sulfurovum sp. NBC37-1]BAF72238.1 conserved hypothetical protein [Sulfurovum sp. NBC37-1]